MSDDDGDSKQLGIDLGTTNSAVAVKTVDGVEMIQNGQGNLVTPSVVYYDRDGGVQVGEEAKRMANARPGRVVEEIKREMENQGYTVEIDGEEHTPPEISTEILKKLKSIAENHFNEDITEEVVVTVPAYFDDPAKDNTLKAAEDAGLDVALANEPEAAAIAYGYDKGRDEQILVFDFGGGTLDIAVIEIEDETYDTQHVGGDMELGGKDLDETLLHYIADEYEEEEGVDFREDERITNEIKDEVERAKKSLSEKEETEILAPAAGNIDGDVVSIEREISRSEFEDVIADELDQARGAIEEAMSEAGLDEGDLDQVLLVGGSSRIPAVQDIVENVTGVEPKLDIAPDRVVAQGAALYSAEADTGGEGDDEDDGRITVKENLTHSIGVKTKTADDEIEIDHLLEKGTKLDNAEETKTYTTTSDNQTSVDIEIYQGEATDPDDDDAKLLGKGSLDGIEEQPAGVPDIEVTFEVDPSSKTLEVVADDRGNPDNDVTITIDRDVAT